MDEMIELIEADADERMGKSIDTMHTAFARIRTGRAHPSLLDPIEVPYYGTDTPLNRVATISVEEARTLVITPAGSTDAVRVPLPALTEENRRDLARHARHEAEAARIAIRNIRRDAIHEVRELLKEKEVAQDEAHRAEHQIQTITDRRIGEVDAALAAKEADLMEI